MLRILLFFVFAFGVQSDNHPSVWTESTVPSTGEPSIIYCDYFPDGTQVDEGNYGDGFCQIGSSNPNEKLLLREIITTRDGETSTFISRKFPGSTVTRVELLNFGRYHGATNAINIKNDGMNGNTEIWIDIFSGKGIRMFLEVYGL